MAPSFLRRAAAVTLLAAAQLQAVSAAAVSSPSVSASATVSGAHSQYTLPASAANGQNVLPWVSDPDAVDPQAHCPGYVASGVAKTADGRGLTANLDLAGPACNVYGNDVAHLALTIETQTVDRVHIEIVPRFLGAENSSWFVLSEALVPRPSGGSQTLPAHGDKGALLDVSWTNEPTFAFTVTRRATGDVLFSTAGRKLVYADQFIEFGTALPADYNLYGLGEVIHGFRLGTNLTRTLFAADAGDPVDGNIYGTHPIYLDTRYFDKATGAYVPGAAAGPGNATYTSATHGVFLRNAHAQEVLLRPEGLTWRLLGGSIDLYVYAGPTAEAVLTAYQQTATGLPALQQYFAFGFHQCRWGYSNWTVLQEVVDAFAAADIPLETIWTDIDYMKQYRNFDNDPVRFGYDEAAAFLGRLHANGQHYIPIVDSAVYAPNPANASDAYPPFDRGVAADAFLLNPDGSLYIGAVWPGYTVFPDWVGAVLNGTGAFAWWTSELARWHDKVAFDGIWIDMSEVSSFCVGSCGSNDLAHNPVHPPFGLPGEPGNLVTEYPENFAVTNASEAAAASAVASSQAAAASATAAPTTSTSTTYLRSTPTPGRRNVNYPPYVLNNIQGELGNHAVSPNATHHGGLFEYEAHNLFGHQILNATHQALQAVHPGRRPLVIGRSTYAGSGKWAGHWGGDNYSKWAYMAFSIPQALSFSIFGVPMFGVDTCGFNGNSDMELCARWMQLSAFFPFYRNHNTLSAIPQEPYRWAAVADASRTAMAIRYRLLPYLYTLFADAHVTGRPVMRALAWEFDAEPALAAADRQFLLGPALLVTPVLEQGAASVDGVFPGAGAATVWYDWYNQTAVPASAAGRNVTIAAPLGHIPLYVRGGHILPLQGAANTTTAARQTPWSLLVALDAAGTAAGSLYLDDGVSETPAATRRVALSVDRAEQQQHACLRAAATGAYADDTNPLANVTVLGVAHAPASVAWNGTPIAGGNAMVLPARSDERCHGYGGHGHDSHGHGHDNNAAPSWTYSADEQRLVVTGLQKKTTGGAWSADWTLTWA